MYLPALVDVTPAYSSVNSVTNGSAIVTLCDTVLHQWLYVVQKPDSVSSSALDYMSWLMTKPCSRISQTWQRACLSWPIMCGTSMEASWQPLKYATGCSKRVYKATYRLTGSLAAAVVEVKADTVINYGYHAACTSACQWQETCGRVHWHLSTVNDVFLRSTDGFMGCKTSLLGSKPGGEHMHLAP